MSKKSPRKANRVFDDRMRSPGQSSGGGHKRRSCHFAPVSFRAGFAASRGTVIRPNHNNNPAGAVSSPIGSSFPTVTAVRTGVNKPRSGPGKPRQPPLVMSVASGRFSKAFPVGCRGGDIYEFCEPASPQQRQITRISFYVGIGTKIGEQKDFQNM